MIEDNFIKHIGSYKFIKEIGKGAFSIVYLGIDVDRNKQIAIKEINKKRYDPFEPDDRKMLDNFKSEIEITKNLNHPNILQLIDLYETDKYINLIFEYCEIGDMQKFIRSSTKKRLDENDARPIIIQMISALLFLNSQKVVHRDLKLANILITSKFEIKIADFGFAKIKADLKNLQSFCGTPITMAPEVLSKQGYDEQCDIWSLGVMIFQIIFGRNPFIIRPEGNASDLLEKIKTKSVQFPPEIQISEALKDLMSRMMIVDPKIRLNHQNLSEHEWVQDNQQMQDTKTVLESIYIAKPLQDQSNIQIASILVQNQARILILKQEISCLIKEIQNQEVIVCLEQFLQMLSNQDIQIKIQFLQDTQKFYFSNGGKFVEDKDFKLIDFYQETYSCLLTNYSHFLERSNQDEIFLIRVVSTLWKYMNEECKTSNSITITATSQDSLEQLTIQLKDNFQNIYNKVRVSFLKNKNQQKFVEQKDLVYKWNCCQDVHPDPNMELELLKTMLEYRMSNYLI